MGKMIRTKYTVLSVICCIFMLLMGCGGEVKENTVLQTQTQEKNIEPSTKPDGSKYRIAYVDYDEYLPASQQLYFILSGLKNMGWIICEEFPFSPDNMSTKEMIYELAKMDLGKYLEFDADAFYYLGYDEEEWIKESLYKHTEELKDIDLVITFGTSAGKFVRDLDLSVPMVDFSATDPVASGIIESSTEGSGDDMVWAQVEPSMPLRQLKYYYSIKPFQKLGVIVYGDETISGVPDIWRASKEVGFEVVKYNMPETERETPEQIEVYYKQVEQEFVKMSNEGIDAFFLTVDLINDMERLPDILKIMYKKNIPVYAMDDTNSAKNGALMIISTYDFENVGYFIADAIAQILNGAVAGELPCVYTSSPYICFNYDVAKEIGYPLDFNFLLSCDEIYRAKEGPYEEE